MAAPSLGTRACPCCGATAAGSSLRSPRCAQCAACGAVRANSVASSHQSRSQPRVSIPRLAPSGVLRDKYQLLEQLGRGAHGVTYLAEHLFVSHLCVVKVLATALIDSGTDFAENLRAEARLGYRVNHPNVVRVLDCDTHAGIWYFVMDYVDGPSLQEVRGVRRPLPWRQVQQLANDALAGLAAIHGLGIVHHDIKPGNLLLGPDDRLRIADLGVARLAREQPRDATLGYSASDGTLVYCAPERLIAGAGVDMRADLYSLGATLYELATGSQVHESDSVFAALIRQQNERVTWPDTQNEAPQWLRAAILRMLEHDPDRRFRDAAAAAAAFSGGESDSKHFRVSRPEPAGPAKGIGVFPLANRSGRAELDWVGFAVTDHLSRNLAKTYKLDVVDLDRLQSAFAGARASGIVDRYRAAGARLGARMIVTGEYSGSDDQLSIQLRFITTADDSGVATTETSGSAGEIGVLQETLLRLTAERLGEAAEASAPRSAARSARLQQQLATARAAYMRADYDEAIRVGEEAIAIDPEFAEAIGFVGVCLARAGRYAEAERHHNRQAELAESRGDQRMLVEAHANLGVMQYFQGQYERAHESYSRAAQDADALGLVSEAAQVFNNLGFVLFRLVRPAEAELAFRRAIETHYGYGAKLQLVGPYNGLGNVLMTQGRHGEAEQYFRKALDLAQEFGDRANLGATHMHLGHCAASQGRFEQAKLEFAMALNALEETRFWNGLARLYERMADMNVQLRHYREAIRCTEQRIALDRQHSNARMEAAGWRQKAAILEASDQTAEAAAARRAAERLEGRGL